ncbi:MAG: TRAP transporter substrate-binding protein [Thermodesulfobacteriota bacterium]
MRRALKMTVFSMLVFGFIVAGLGSAAPLSPSPASAQTPAKTVHLKLAIHLPTIHHATKNLFLPWAAEVEKRTEGRVKVTVYPDQQLGKLPEMYDALSFGTCDIAFILPVFIRGRFPLEGVFHLPTLVPGDVGDPTCTAIRTMIYEKYLTPLYFKDIKILWTGRFGLNNLQMAAKSVRNLEDLKGKVIGFGGGKTPPLVLKALGAAPESIQSPDMYTSLEKKVVDGVLFPLDAMRGYKLVEVVKHVTRIDFGSASNFTAIRKKAWDSLPPADQKIISDLIPWALAAQAKTYREDTLLAIETGKKAGIEFIDLSPAERQRWVEVVTPVDKEWIKEMDGMGLPASKMYQDILPLRGK